MNEGKKARLDSRNKDDIVILISIVGIVGHSHVQRVADSGIISPVSSKADVPRWSEELS